MQQRMQHVYCRIFSGSSPVWVAKMFYLWWIWDYNIPTFKVMQYGWVSMLCFVCEHPSVCFGVYLYVWANGWWWREPGKNRETVPAVFSWVGFHLRASNKPLRFLSRTHHLDLKTRTHVTASLNMLVHKKGWLQYCVTDCNIIVEVRTILTAHTVTKRLCVHLIAQARIYFQLFCVITLTHRQFISQLRY